MKAWGESLNTSGKVDLYADWDASFVKHTDLSLELPGAGLGVRAKRFSMIVDNGKIVKEFVEASAGE
jgi:peroxiredoxin